MAHQHDHHDHSHAHGHAGHSHAPDNFGFAFAVGIALNTAFVAAELVFGYAANSLALISDAVHNFSDVIALVLAWAAGWLARRRPTERHTYGYRRASILAALANAGLLLIAVGAIAVEAIDRIRQPAEVAGLTVVLVAALGIVVNGATALLFMRGRHGDLNIRGAYLHMAADAGVSAGVVVAALAIMLTGWLWVDPAISLVIAAVVLAGSWGLARDSVNLALDGVPRGIALAAVRDYLGQLEGVTEVHDLHVWAMSTNETALTAHLVRPGGTDDSFLHQVCARTRASLRHPSRHAADRGRQRCLQAGAGGGGVGRSGGRHAGNGQLSAALPPASLGFWGNPGRRGRTLCPCLSRRHSGPALEGVGEGADFAVTEQPGDLRNRQVAVPQVTPGEVALQILRDSREGQSFRGKPARQRPVAHADAGGRLRRRSPFRAAATEPWRFPRSSAGWRVPAPGSDGLFAVLHQQFVEMAVRAADRHACDRDRGKPLRPPRIQIRHRIPAANEIPQASSCGDAPPLSGWESIADWSSWRHRRTSDTSQNSIC